MLKSGNFRSYHLGHQSINIIKSAKAPFLIMVFIRRTEEHHPYNQGRPSPYYTTYTFNHPPIPAGLNWCHQRIKKVQAWMFYTEL